MNLCKSGIISARTKSLREKFSRHRSYSELSFKETNNIVSSSLVSTPTESCSGSLATATSQTNFLSSLSRKNDNDLSGGSSTSGNTPQHQFVVNRDRLQSHHTSTSQLRHSTIHVYNDDPYGSAFDLSAPTLDEPRFPWQRDAAIQCDLLTSSSSTTNWSPAAQAQAANTSATSMYTNITNHPAFYNTNNAHGNAHSYQPQHHHRHHPSPLAPANSLASNKRGMGKGKKTSSSSASSAASTLINAAAATLRMTGIGSSDSDGSQSGNPSGNGNKFWKSSLLLPNFNLNSNGKAEDEGGCLRRQKSYRWPGTKVSIGGFWIVSILMVILFDSSPRSPFSSVQSALTRAVATPVWFKVLHRPVRRPITATIQAPSSMTTTMVVN